jgi:DnaJ family protein C protein 8
VSLIILFIQAESELSDKSKREELDAVIQQGRILVLKSLSLPLATPDDDPKLRGLVPPFKARLRQESKDLLIEEEVRRRKAVKMNLANEGLEARKKDEEVASRKRKVEEDKQWEGMKIQCPFGS